MGDKKQNNQPFKMTYSQIPEVNFKDRDKWMKHILNKTPVIIKGSDLLGPGWNWTLDYLEKHISPNTEWKVHKSGGKNFQYHDDAKNLANYEYKPLFETTYIKFSEFVKALKESEAQPPEKKTSYVYLQNMISGENLSEQLLRDAGQFNWQWILDIKKEANFGELKHNAIWIGEGGDTTMCHYDEQENFYALVEGNKNFKIFSPDNFRNLYPFPYYHTCDRQTQVDIENPDLEKFPNFRNAVGMEYTLTAGDLLYLPIFWWHQVSSVGRSVAINFWFLGGPEEVQFPLKEAQVAAVRRNIEKIIGQAVGPEAVGEFLKDLTYGRFDYVKLKKQY